MALPFFSPSPLSYILSLGLSSLHLPHSICLGWRFVLIRGLCWLALLSLAVQKGTNWQWANESPLSPSCAQLPPRSPPSHPPSLSLPLLLLPLFTPPLPPFCPVTLPAHSPTYWLFTPVPFFLSQAARVTNDESSSHQTGCSTCQSDLLSHPHRHQWCYCNVPWLILSYAVQKAADDLSRTRVKQWAVLVGVGSL